jgi:hypothetical protein
MFSLEPALLRRFSSRPAASVHAVKIARALPEIHQMHEMRNFFFTRITQMKCAARIMLAPYKYELMHFFASE